MNAKRVLLTGSDGFVGKYLVDLLRSEGHELCQLDCDIRSAGDVEKQVSEFSPEVIYHLAAISYVPDCQDDFKTVLNVNVNGTYNLTNAASNLKHHPRFIYVSSANVYGVVQAEDLPLKEDSEVKPSNNYALSKYLAEEVVNLYARRTSAETVIFRPFNHIGPGQRTEFVVADFASQVADIKNGVAKPELKVGDLSPQRDFTDVRDIVRAYALALNSGNGVYNLCSGEARSIQMIVDTLIKLSGVDISLIVESARLRQNELPVLCGDAAKAKQDLGWSPKISFEESLSDIFDAFL